MPFNEKQNFIVSHTHWDREWYMSFESHRARPVELFDTLIETMEKTPDYKYFHMDGQTIVIEDYLEINKLHKTSKNCAESSAQFFIYTAFSITATKTVMSSS